jgi:RNA polymerase sigma-70 factor, ECF subfamily
MKDPQPQCADESGIVPVTQLLRRIRAKDPGARKELFELLYEDLYVRAKVCMQGQQASPILQPTVLVHEAYLRMCRGAWNDRKHFFVAAAQAMRHVIIDYRRARSAGAEGDEVLEGLAMAFDSRAVDIEALHVALDRLAEKEPDMARAVVLRFFGGVEEREAARMVGMPVRTYQRRWPAVRAWLYKEVR